MDVSLKQLEIFTSVVVAGSITKASRRIGLSQPSISQQLGKMEESLGIQLFLRSRTKQVELTVAGEYWFKSASELLQRYDAVVEDHVNRFSKDTLTLKMGTTPTLRGRFAGAAARVAMEVDSFVRFEHVWALTSSELVERLRLHQLNCAIVNAQSLRQDQSSFRITPIFRDQLAWVVPREVPLAAMRQALTGDRCILERYPALARYVSMTDGAPMQAESTDWYRHTIPAATAVFGTMTYVSAVDLAAEGLATTHCPLSLLPNLPQSVIRRLRWFALEDLGRDVVLAMPKHLLSLSGYARVHDGLLKFASKSYNKEMRPACVEPFASIWASETGAAMVDG